MERKRNIWGVESLDTLDSIPPPSPPSPVQSPTDRHGFTDQIKWSITPEIVVAGAMNVNGLVVELCSTIMERSRDTRDHDALHFLFRALLFVFNIDIVGIFGVLYPNFNDFEQSRSSSSSLTRYRWNFWCYIPKFQRLLNFSAPLILTLGGLVFRTRDPSFSE
jgi:hypothetical protein